MQIVKKRFVVKRQDCQFFKTQLKRKTKRFKAKSVFAGPPGSDYQKTSLEPRPGGFVVY